MFLDWSRLLCNYIVTIHRFILLWIQVDCEVSISYHILCVTKIPLFVWIFTVWQQFDAQNPRSACSILYLCIGRLYQTL